MLCVCVGDVMDVVFSVCLVRRGAVGACVWEVLVFGHAYVVCMCLVGILWQFYIADMPRPIEPVRRVCYADDITVWDTVVKIPDLEDSINNYLEEITAYLKDNSLLIYAPVFSHVVQPGPTLSQDPSENTH